MSDIAGLIRSPGALRVRRLGPAAEGALHTGYDIWDPLDYYFSELGARWLAGEVKGVMMAVPAKYGRAFETFNIVPTPIAERPAAADRHRQRLLTVLQAQYRNAVVSAIAAGGKRAKRMRHRSNAALGTSAPTIADTDRHFADHPEALAAAKGIKQLWQEVAA